MEGHANKIGRITPSGTLTEFSVPTGNSDPDGITSGPDGNLWFTEYSGNKIGRITTSGVVTEFDAPSAYSAPRNITTWSDGNIWFIEEAVNKIGRITTSGVVTEFDAPIGEGPRDITSGPDGNIWFTETIVSTGIDKIGRINLSNTPIPTNTPVPTPDRGKKDNTILAPFNNGVKWKVISGCEGGYS